MKFLEWIALLLHAFEKGFKEQRSSYRTKYEEGIPLGLVEVLPGKSAQGKKNLLRPLENDVSAWQWHPLFKRTEDIFSLLDRKVPA